MKKTLLPLVGNYSNSENQAVSRPDKNTKVNYEYLWAGWLSVAITASIVITKQVLESQANSSESSRLAQAVLNGLYPAAFSHLSGVFGAGVGIDICAVLKNGPEYYKEGHNDFHVDLLPDSYPDLVWAIVWGIHASWKLSAIFSFLELIPTGIFAAIGSPLPFEYISYALLIATAVGIVNAYMCGEQRERQLKNNIALSLFYMSGFAEVKGETAVDRGVRRDKYILEQMPAMLQENFLMTHYGQDNSKVELSKIQPSQRLPYVKSAAMTSSGYSFFPKVAVATLATSIVVGAVNSKTPIPGLK